MIFWKITGLSVIVDIVVVRVGPEINLSRRCQRKSLLFDLQGQRAFRDDDVFFGNVAVGIRMMLRAGLKDDVEIFKAAGD